MIRRTIKVSCDWCENFEETMNTRQRIQTFERKVESYGWLKMIEGDGGVRHFCCQECFDFFKKDTPNKGGSDASDG